MADENTLLEFLKVLWEVLRNFILSDIPDKLLAWTDLSMNFFLNIIREMIIDLGGSV